MAHKKKEFNVVQLLEKSHDETFQRTDQFRDLLINLRYEGKLSLGKNLKQAEDVLKFFSQEHAGHMQFEEEILFPYLKSHVPKLEPVIYLLHAEHLDFKNNLKNFENLIGELSKERQESDRAVIFEKIRETGAYLIFLLRSHNQSESESVYKVIDRELHDDEKEELAEKIEKFLP
ncbi:MAG: hemerythrin domain-containing protein [Candidatus Omnitrophica bacterium]|nr:hemerythrin domain-containing protein [Candidatus Omnitrophota bacterium]